MAEPRKDRPGGGRGEDAPLLSRLAAALVLRRLLPDGRRGAAEETAAEDRAGAGTPPGRRARRPSEFGWSDWKQILGRVFAEMGEDNVSLIAAGVAFYAMLALFPAIGAFVGIYGIFSDPATIASHLSSLQRLAPPEAFALIEDQVTKIASGGPTTLGLASAIALLFSLWSARTGIAALITGLNVVYDERDERGFLAATALALALTLVLIALLILAFVAIVAAPAILEALPLGPVGGWIAEILRWPLGLLAVIVAIGVLYRWAPCRAPARFRWFSWGAMVAALVWLAGSALFSFYVANFGSYNETYGSLGAVIALMMWFWLSAFIVLMGAELNAEMEHQTRRDTTTGPPRPMGQRGAYVADTVPRS